MAPNGFPGGQAVLMLIPLVMVGAAIWVLTIAVRGDQGGRPKHSLSTLPNPNSHPLHHVRVAMASTKRKAKVAARRAQAPPPDSGEAGSPAAEEARPPASREVRRLREV